MATPQFVKSVVIEDNDLIINGASFPYFIGEDIDVTSVVEENGDEFYKKVSVTIDVLVPADEGWGEDRATFEDRRTSPRTPIGTLTLPLWTTYEGGNVPLGEFTVDVDGTVDHSTTPAPSVKLTPHIPPSFLEQLNAAITAGIFAPTTD